MKKIEQFTYRDETLATKFIESSQVFPGVVCDVYLHPETNERDLGVIYIEAGINTAPQKIKEGTETTEGYISGRGILVILKPSGEKIEFQVGPENEGFAHTIEVGDIMQWQAVEDLVVFEICYPPYQDGRFENLEQRSLSDRIELKSVEDTVGLKELISEDAEFYFSLIDADREHLSQNGDTTAKKYSSVKDVSDSIINPQNISKFRFGIWDGDEMVGSNNLRLKGNDTAELGSWIGKEKTGNNYAARARNLLVDFAFNHLGLKEVYSEIVVGNIASRKSVEKSGFELTEEKDGRWIFTLKRN